MSLKLEFVRRPSVSDLEETGVSRSHRACSRSHILLKDESPDVRADDAFEENNVLRIDNNNHIA